MATRRTFTLLMYSLFSSDLMIKYVEYSEYEAYAYRRCEESSRVLMIIVE